MHEQMTVDQAHDRAERLAMELLTAVGFVDDGHGALVGNVSVGIGVALGIAAARVMAAASDDSFLNWIESVCGERNRTHAEHLTEQ